MSAGAVVASDTYHDRCRDWLLSTDEVRLVPPTVLAETCYLIDRGLGADAEATFLDDVGIGEDYPYQLVDLLDTVDTLNRARAPVDRGQGPG